MPLDEDFGSQICSSNADLCNVCIIPFHLIQNAMYWYSWVGSWTAVLFLKAFADGIEAKDGQEARMKWAHLDIAGSMEVCVMFN